MNICRFGSGNWFFSCVFAQFSEAASTKSCKSCAPAREKCNKYDVIDGPCF